ITDILEADMGGHGRALELLAEGLKGNDKPDIAQLATGLRKGLEERYTAAVNKIRGCFPAIVQCILSKRLIRRESKIPGTSLHWEDIIELGLVWFEEFEGEPEKSEGEPEKSELGLEKSEGEPEKSELGLEKSEGEPEKSEGGLEKSEGELEKSEG